MGFLAHLQAGGHGFPDSITVHISLYYSFFSVQHLTNREEQGHIMSVLLLFPLFINFVLDIFKIFFYRDTLAYYL